MPNNVPELTLDLTGGQATYPGIVPTPGGRVIHAEELEPVKTELGKKEYDQKKQWDFVRMIVTLGLLAMLGWVIVWASIESASWSNHWAQTKEMLQTILPAITGLLGSVIGFYFGSNSNTNDRGKSGNTGTASGSGK